MAKISLVFGGLLIVVGLVGYLTAGADASWTALIPAIFGVIFIGLGAVAMQLRYRMLAMHIAVVVALLAMVGSGMRLIKVFSDGIGNTLAFASQLITFALCLIFIILAVRSFINARSGTNTAV